MDGLVAALWRMYEEAMAQALVADELSALFDIRKGVMQGCPSSPLLSSLFLDRVESLLS